MRKVKIVAINPQPEVKKAVKPKKKVVPEQATIQEPEQQQEPEQAKIQEPEQQPEPEQAKIQEPEAKPVPEQPTIQEPQKKYWVKDKDGFLPELGFQTHHEGEELEVLKHLMTIHYCITYGLVPEMVTVQ